MLSRCAQSREGGLKGLAGMGGGSESESLLSACVHVSEAVRDGRVVAQSGGGGKRYMGEDMCSEREA